MNNNDINNKFTNIQNERNIKYQLNNTFYNPITNVKPKKIETNTDLLLNNYEDNYDFKKLLINKQNERLVQDNNINFINTNVYNNIDINNPNLPYNK